MLKYPELYKTSQNALDFNTKVGCDVPARVWGICFTAVIMWGIWSFKAPGYQPQQVQFA